MPETTTTKYDADPHIAEIYDRREAAVAEDVALVRRLIGGSGTLKIFEPFCGTGRMLIPLAEDGHQMVGLDESGGMLSRLEDKTAQREDLAGRITLIRDHVFAGAWPDDVDLVLLGGNCFYDVSSSDEQRALIFRAGDALRPGGHVFLDNDDHQSSILQPGWCNPPGRPRKAFPSGRCGDATVLAGSTETAWFDLYGRFVHYVRRLTVTPPDGPATRHVWEETCHPTIMADCLAWLGDAGFEVERTFGAKDGRPYGPQAPRCVVWARRN